MKRLFEGIIALLLLVLLAPVFIMVSIMILLFMGRPIFFIQERPGLYSKPFKFYKFRTMRNDKQNDEQRITSLGKLLRKLSLDEIPQLVNVIKGDISFVGPRPLLMEYLPMYSEEQLRRHDVKPGITGWAQINGRNSLTWPARLKLDVWYVDNQSILLDLKIIIHTLYKVLRMANIGHGDKLIMSKFKGEA